jgi:hypothetical protein
MHPQQLAIITPRNLLILAHDAPAGPWAASVSPGKPSVRRASAGSVPEERGGRIKKLRRTHQKPEQAHQKVAVGVPKGHHERNKNKGAPYGAPGRC